MSAPHTDVEKQKKKHRTPLLGMRAVVLWSLILLVLLIAFIALTGNEPTGADEVVDGRTGEIEAVEE
jgi:hypothetical protein